MPTPRAGPRCNRARLADIIRRGQTVEARKRTVDRLYGLDALRGVAALGVAIFHWRDFLRLDGRSSENLDPTVLPFHEILSVLYDYGWMAVDLFFCLSGFVFFWLYQEPVAQRQIGGAKFTVLRFSRLYPLLFAMLLVAALGQYMFHARMGTFFVTHQNDAVHFLLDLFMVQSWGLHDDSFNGPAWSLSIEFLLYIIFFLMARASLLRHWATAVAMMVIGIAIKHFHDEIGRGISSFFEGGLVYMLFSRIYMASWARRASLTIMAVAVAGWFMMLSLNALGGPAGLARILGEIPALNGNSVLTRLSHFHGQSLVIYLVFPATVLAIALHERCFSTPYRHLSWLGDISYSSYLIHFPLQLAAALCFAYGLMTPAAFFDKVTFLAFFAVLIPLSYAIHHFYERPAQHFIRKGMESLLTRRPATG